MRHLHGMCLPWPVTQQEWTPTLHHDQINSPTEFARNTWMDAKAQDEAKKKSPLNQAGIMSSNLTTLMLLKSSLLRFCRCPVGRCSPICRRFATKLFTFGNLQHYIQLRTRGLKNSQLLIWGTTLMKYRSLRTRRTACNRHRPMERSSEVYC